MAGARKKIELFTEIQSEKEFEHALKIHADRLICAEIYCTFAGSCTALDKLFTVIKLDWTNGKIVLLKVPADEIQVLERFRNHSEPVYMFIVNHRVTKVFRGVDSLKFAEVAKREWSVYTGSVEFNRQTYEIQEPTPDETKWIQKKLEDRQLEKEAVAAKKEARQAARKRHRAELMVPHLQILNFVLFWPHCFHAHPELYEKWDDNNIIMVGREEVDLTEEVAKDVLYAGDAPLNEASLHKLLSGPALAICFRLLDTDKHFVSLVRKILYEDFPVYDESKKADAQTPHKTAFDLYKTYSPTREQIMEQRYKERVQRREEAIERRARRLSEMQRLARQDIEDALASQKKKREERRLELLKSGNLEALKEFDLQPDEEINIEIPEELRDAYVEEDSDEDPDEYLPPPGLLIPGFYTPPNDVAKVNGLAVLFPKIISDYVTPEPEFLPPHVLVMMEISKAHKCIAAMLPYTKFIIHIGVFKATSPYDGKHIAYSVKQYETLDKDSWNECDVMLVLMLSLELELPLLLLTELGPTHVSRDHARGADESAALFPENYADNYYPEMEDFE